MYLRVHVRNFAVECAAGGASEALRLVFVLLASNLEHDYLGLYVVLEASEDGGHGAARLAQLGPPVPSVVRQQVHEMLGSSVVQSLAVRARRPAGSRRYEAANMDWLLKEFPWADGRTIITTRAAVWTELHRESGVLLLLIMSAESMESAQAPLPANDCRKAERHRDRQALRGKFCRGGGM